MPSKYKLPKMRPEASDGGSVSWCGLVTQLNLQETREMEQASAQRPLLLSKEDLQKQSQKVNDTPTAVNFLVLTTKLAEETAEICSAANNLNHMPSKRRKDAKKEIICSPAYQMDPQAAQWFMTKVAEFIDYVSSPFSFRIWCDAARMLLMLRGGNAIDFVTIWHKLPDLWRKYIRGPSCAAAAVAFFLSAIYRYGIPSPMPPSFYVEYAAISHYADSPCAALYLLRGLIVVGRNPVEQMKLCCPEIVRALCRFAPDAISPPATEVPGVVLHVMTLIAVRKKTVLATKEVADVVARLLGKCQPECLTEAGSLIGMLFEHSTSLVDRPLLVRSLISTMRRYKEKAGSAISCLLRTCFISKDFEPMEVEVRNSKILDDLYDACINCVKSATNVSNWVTAYFLMVCNISKLLPTFVEKFLTDDTQIQFLRFAKMQLSPEDAAALLEGLRGMLKGDCRPEMCYDSQFRDTAIQLSMQILDNYSSINIELITFLLFVDELVTTVGESKSVSFDFKKQVASTWFRPAVFEHVVMIGSKIDGEELSTLFLDTIGRLFFMMCDVPMEFKGDEFYAVLMKLAAHTHGVRVLGIICGVLMRVAPMVFSTDAMQAEVDRCKNVCHPRELEQDLQTLIARFRN